MTLPTNAPRPTVLLVDDTPDNLTIIGELLSPHFTVKLANTGERGLKIAQSETPPDLILLDIMMPGLDGFEVCRRLKAFGPTRDIPVIFLTALSDTGDMHFGFGLGAVDYVTKPVVPQVLLARVRVHLALKAAADRLHTRAATLEEQTAQCAREIVALRAVVADMENLLGKGI